jgi:sugar phosphate isomerase/epimerase
MKVALQLGLIPGASTSDKAKWARDHGVEGLELSAFTGKGMDGFYSTADEINGVVPICSVCGNADLEGNSAFNFLHPEKAKRRASIEGTKAILKFCGEVGAVGQIVPPIFGGPAVPDLTPWMTPLQIEDALMLEACKEIGPHAMEHKTLFMLEPLNRYEQHYLRTQQNGVDVIERAKAAGISGGIGLLSDFFHMHIEELSTPDTFRSIGKYVNHVHLADNTRQEPGTGDINFVAGFKALKEAGFGGYMAYECGITGETDAEKEANLKKSLEFVRDCIARALA